MKKEQSAKQQDDVMEALKKRNKSKKIVILIIIAIVLIFVVWFVQRSVKSAAKAMQAVLAETMQAEEVSRRSLIKSVGATGTIVSTRTKDLTTTLTGVDIKEVKVEVGDEVFAGQELLVFDTSDIEENLESAERQLAIAQERNALSAQDAKRNVADAERTENYQVDSAKANVENSYSQYKSASSDYNDASGILKDLKNAENKAYNNYTTAQKEMESAGELLKTKEELLVTADAKLQKVSSVSDGDAVAYKKALTAYNQAKQERDTALVQYNAAKEKVSTLENTYNSTKTSREAQQKTVDGLKEQMNSQANSYNSSVKSYDNTVASQASSVEGAKSNQQSSSLNANTDSEREQVEQYEEQLEEGILEAPFGGIVTAVNYEVGDTYTQGAVITIQDCSAYEVEAEIGEYDISDIQIGQKVLIKTDATREEELEGTVIFISPTASERAAGSSDVTYTVRISIDTPNDRLRLDMSASLSIIIEEHEDVYTVPYNAVQTDEAGNSFIELIGEDGVTTTQLPVTVEMESSYYTEISADSLEEGQKVKVVNTDDGFQGFEIIMEGGGF